MTKEERIKKQKDDLVRMMAYERELYKNGNVKYIAGVDEVGRGPLAGPVVTAAVILPPDFNILGVNDSKKLSEKRREALYDEIINAASAWSIGIRSNEVIDKINILNATKEAMLSAVESLDIKPDHILVDALTIPGTDIPQTGIIKGDENSVSIAAASILAKVTRDRMMVEYHKIYPDYAFDKNKGYGTKAHYEGLDRAGACEIHRQSFLVKYFAGKR
jgi:ribonuclease HII